VKFVKLTKSAGEESNRRPRKSREIWSDQMNVKINAFGFGGTLGGEFKHPPVAKVALVGDV
jgi:hypothetical protein